MTILQTGATNDVTYQPRVRQTSYSAPDETLVGNPRLAINKTGSRDVLIDPSAMDQDQPYGYRLDGAEYVVYRRANGRLEFYELPAR
jgi:hypothetical protein